MEDINEKAENDEFNFDAEEIKYQPTIEQKKAFGLLKHHGVVPTTQQTVKPKPTHGKLIIQVRSNLWQDVPNCIDLPFPLLQVKKQELINSGVASSKLKIVYNK